MFLNQASRILVLLLATASIQISPALASSDLKTDDQAVVSGMRWLLVGSPIRDKSTGDMLALECVEGGPENCTGFRYLNVQRVKEAGYEVKPLTSKILTVDDLKSLSDDIRRELTARGAPNNTWLFSATYISFLGGLWIAAKSNDAGGKALGFGMMILTPVALAFDVVKDVVFAPFLRLRSLFTAHRLKGKLGSMKNKDKIINLSAKDFADLRYALFDALASRN